MDDAFQDIEVDYALPREISYDIRVLGKFCEGDSDCFLTFYGGEPLLCPDKIKSIMDEVKAKEFMMQTNGLLLDRLEPHYVNRLHTILVSVDGEEALTDYYRGAGVFARVMENLRLIKRNGFKGELIARMTVMEQTDIYKQVKWLLQNKQFAFSSIHWQLNAGFWGNDFAKRDFKKWSDNSYNLGIRRLAKFWVDCMETDGNVPRLYPLLGIAQSLLAEEESSLRCGGGWINYAIQTDGYIIPCPTMWGMKEYYLGHISNTNPLDLKKVWVGSQCAKCKSFTLCGGRCLYTNVTKRWNDEAYALVCNTVKNLIDAVTNELPRIRKLIQNGQVKLSDFKYLKFNGCEIIP